MHAFPKLGSRHEQSESGIYRTMTGILKAKSGQYKLIISVGWATLGRGCGLLRILGADTTVAAWIFINLVAGTEIGVLTIAQSIAAQAATEPKHAAIAAGLTPFCRALGHVWALPSVARPLKTRSSLH
ncbi:hypothetical protein BAUCODRAFT_36826 [Baudoinia panamericana UAMH 10762]|uniref:Uncharacterized protein n=1 Tax=Baudoinia panamericana (strain UAMH 10762) TaxID=717646 RepID=M2M9Q4_BAUPA|nr:uncharacterized protein BAUCODRAFT_36826 [Baudoinia panamericana UAMH 10762]EMC93161.1 hypothetical protein BAUCODRAFT_36826 [Baudoinia panamericana UAMH 10762]